MTHYKVVQKVALVSVLALALPLAAYAEASSATQSAITTSSGNVYAAGGNVTFGESAAKDLDVAGGSVLVSSPVGRDLAAAGGTVTVLGAVGDDLRVVGGTIIVQNSVKNDFVAAGGNVTLAGSGVGGDVLAAGGNVVLGAPIGGSVRVYGSNVTIDAPVSGSVEVHAQKLTLGSQARIRGDLTYSAKEAAVMEEGASVTGATHFTQSTSTPEVAPALALFVSLWMLAKFLMLLIGAFLILWLLPGYARMLAHESAERSLASLGFGFVFLVVAPVLGVLLLVTILGMPIGFVVLLAWAACLVTASLMAPISAGSLLFSWFGKSASPDWKTVLVGTVVYFLLGFIPFVGWILKLLLFLVALGAGIMAVRSRLK
jgi:cytoskeletal protein CcmA (bactofilin family)